jgi:hypothetical protein
MTTNFSSSSFAPDFPPPTAFGVCAVSKKNALNEKQIASFKMPKRLHRAIDSPFPYAHW